MVIIDQAGWHKAKLIKIPDNLSILHLSSYSPELNPQENIWLYMKDTFLSNRVFDNIESITNACCEAWNSLVERPQLITSIGTRKWATLI